MHMFVCVSVDLCFYVCCVWDIKYGDSHRHSSVCVCLNELIKLHYYYIILISGLLRVADLIKRNLYLHPYLYSTLFASTSGMNLRVFIQHHVLNIPLLLSFGPTASPHRPSAQRYVQCSFLLMPITVFLLFMFLISLYNFFIQPRYPLDESPS